MSRYAGMKVGQVNKQFGENEIVQQALIAKSLIKNWAAEHKEELRKYNQLTLSLKKRADGINEWMEDKGPLSLEERDKVEKEFNGRARMANQLMKDLVEDYKQKMTKAGVSSSL